jgi:hypothetical protein
VVRGRSYRGLAPRYHVFNSRFRSGIDLRSIALHSKLQTLGHHSSHRFFGTEPLKRVVQRCLIQRYVLNGPEQDQVPLSSGMKDFGVGSAPSIVSVVTVG